MGIQGDSTGSRRYLVHFRGVSGGLMAVPRKFNDQGHFKASLETTGAFQEIAEEFRGIQDVSGAFQRVSRAFLEVSAAFYVVSGGSR